MRAMRKLATGSRKPSRTEQVEEKKKPASGSLVKESNEEANESHEEISDETGDTEEKTESGEDSLIAQSTKESNERSKPSSGKTNKADSNKMSLAQGGSMVKESTEETNEINE